MQYAGTACTYRQTISSYLALLACAIVLFFPLVAWADVAAHVHFVSGKVTAASGKVRTLAKGADILSRDTITTSSNGRIQMRFTDGGLVSLMPGTVFAVEEYQHGASDKEDTLVFNLVQGGLRSVTGAVGKKNQAAYKLKTPVGTLGIRGTEFVAVMNGTDALLVHVSEGGVAISNDHGSIEVPAGNSARMDINSAPVLTDEQPAFVAQAVSSGAGAQAQPPAESSPPHAGTAQAAVEQEISRSAVATPAGKETYRLISATIDKTKLGIVRAQGHAKVVTEYGMPRLEQFSGQTANGEAITWHQAANGIQVGGGDLPGGTGGVLTPGDNGGTGGNVIDPGGGIQLGNQVIWPGGEYGGIKWGLLGEGSAVMHIGTMESQWQFSDEGFRTIYMLASPLDKPIEDYLHQGGLHYRLGFATAIFNADGSPGGMLGDFKLSLSNGAGGAQYSIMMEMQLFSAQMSMMANGVLPEHEGGSFALHHAAGTSGTLWNCSGCTIDLGVMLTGEGAGHAGVVYQMQMGGEGKVGGVILDKFAPAGTTTP